jgi:hypothetical protein
MPWQHGLDDRRSFLAGLIDWCGPAPPLAADIAGKKVLERELCTFVHLHLANGK